MREHIIHSAIGKARPQREAKAAVVSAGTGAKTIYTGTCVLERIEINAALVGTLTITGMQDETPTNANFVIPASAAARTIHFGAEIATALSVQKSSASDDGKIVVIYRPVA